MNIKLTEAMTWIYPDQLDAIKAWPADSILDVPRGGIASLALVVQHAEKAISIKASSSDVCVFEMVDVCVNRNTCEYGFAAINEHKPASQSIVRKAPYRVYDALKPVKDTIDVDNGTAVLLIQVPVSGKAKPGTVTYTIDVSDGISRQSAEFTVRISSVRIPETGAKSAFLTNWFSINAIIDYENVTAATPKFWNELKKHAELMYRARQNTFLIPLSHFMSYENGTYSLNEKVLAKIIRIFTEAGLYWIEGGHFGSRGEGGWEAPEFVIWGSRHAARSIEGNKDIAQMAALLNKFIKKYGLKDRWIQHVADEPIKVNSDSYRIFAGLVRKYMPGIPLLDAMSDPAIAGAPDIWCPQVQEYHQHKADFDDIVRLGDHVWCYTCCMPGGIWLNRLCDEELTRPLLLGWGCGFYGLEGFLHWGWNQYICNYQNHPGRQDPFEETSPAEFHGAENLLPPGDSHIVYPAKNGSGVWSSMRLEAQREGMEDWELIRMLAKKDKATCDKIVNQVFRTFNDYTADPTAIRKARRQLLEALEQA